MVLEEDLLMDGELGWVEGGGVGGDGGAESEEGVEVC